jgi:ribonuclease P protein component
VIHAPAPPDAPPEPPRVAFAVPRKVGNAVTRNRIRRCVRGRLADRVRDRDGGLPSGAYLVTVGPEAAGLDARSLAHLVEGCLDDLEARR